MTCTNFWNTQGVDVPWGELDADARLNFTFDVTEWLAASGTALTLDEVVFINHPDLAISTPVVAGAIITVRIEWVPNPARSMWDLFPFTLRFTASDGQRDERTFYLQYTKR